MGTRGPAPLPTHLKLVKGVRKDRINNKEPKVKPVETKLTPPTWLSTDAKKIWKRTVKQLEDMGILFEADLDLIAAYANAVDVYKQATMEINQHGILIEGRRDGQVKNPAVQIQKDAAEIIRKIGSEFGLSPSSRSRIKVEGNRDDSADFLD